MSTLHARPHLAGVPGAAPAFSRIWGLDPTELHDRLWAARGLQVVRCAANVGEAPDPRGPRLFLLLGADQLASLDLARVMRRFRTLDPALMRVRIMEPHSHPYVERVLADAAGRFQAIRREYRRGTRAAARASITGDIRLAQMWREAPSERDAWRRVRARIGRDRTATWWAGGRTATASCGWADAAAFRVLLDFRSGPGVAIDGVYEFEPGVWAHESTLIAEGVKFVPPVWLGAGVVVPRGAIVIGPSWRPDAPGAECRVRPFEWDSVRAPGWRLLPRVRRRRLRRVTKRLFDIGFSLCVLAATAPLYPLIILAIVIEDGWPPFFAHRRQTLRGREFPCYKFRTMRRDAERLRLQLAGMNRCDGPQFYIPDDPRLLRVGKFLRKYQLDELPQFWNVLLGHMSVVGPRPSPEKENQFCPAWREARLSVRPGVTGLWQVKRTRQPETDFQEWIRYDLEYVQHESWRMDLWIIFRTVLKVIGG